MRYQSVMSRNIGWKSDVGLMNSLIQCIFNPGKVNTDGSCIRIMSEEHHIGHPCHRGKFPCFPLSHLFSLPSNATNFLPLLLPIASLLLSSHGYFWHLSACIWSQTLSQHLPTQHPPFSVQCKDLYEHTQAHTCHINTEMPVIKNGLGVSWWYMNHTTIKKIFFSFFRVHWPWDKEGWRL